MERKTFTASLATKIQDAAEGVVTAIFAVFGNVDSGSDRIHPGAFAKTFHERGHKVKVTDSHRTETGMAVIATIKELRELGPEDLPSDLLAEYPEASGGAEATMQFLMDTFAGKEMFIRIKAGALDEWSFAYEPLDFDFETVMIDGDEKTIRNLRTIKLYELGPVVFGMNQATTTTGAKAEAKPWATFPVADEWCVFRIDEQGERMGDSLGCHATETEADAQVRALFASEEAEKDEALEEDLIESINQEMRLTVRDIVLEVLTEIGMTDNAPAPDVRAADTDQGDEKAGPDIPPTSEVTLEELDVLMLQLESMEVE